MNIAAAISTPAHSRANGELTLYACLPAPSSSTLERCAMAINAARAKSIEALFEAGRQLQIAHDELAHHGDGLFGKWVKQECRMSRSAAYDAMRLVEVFGVHQALVCPPGGQTFDIKALYHLSRDATPEAAIKDALRLAEAGERVTLGCAKKLVAAYTVEQAAGDGRQDKELVSLEPGLVDFESAIRDETLRWWELCPPPDRRSMPESLRRIAAEMESRLGTESRDDDCPNSDQGTGAAAANQLATNDTTILSNH